VDNGSAYGGTMAPPEVLRYASSSSSARTLTFSGLSTANTYSLELYASRNNTGYSTVFTVGTTSVTVVTDKNLTNKASFVRLVPSASGQVVVSIKGSTTFNYLNGFVLTEHLNKAPVANARTGQEHNATHLFCHACRLCYRCRWYDSRVQVDTGIRAGTGYLQFPIYSFYLCKCAEARHLCVPPYRY
jgi:hypothetical protein